MFKKLKFNSIVGINSQHKSLTHKYIPYFALIFLKKYLEEKCLYSRYSKR